MADLEGNIEALRRVVGAALPLYDNPQLDPQINASDMPVEPARGRTVATTAIASPLKIEEPGYELHITPSSSLGVAVLVWFAAPAGDSANGIALRPGECVRVPRGFRWFWLQSVGEAGTLQFEIVRAPTVHQYGEQAIWAPRAISVQGPNPGTWVSGDHVAAASGTVSSDTGALAAGDYEIRAWYGGNDNGGWPGEFQWRNAANSANNQIFVCGANRVQNNLYIPRLTVAASERFRWVLQGAHTAGTHTSTGIWYRRVY